MDRGFHLLDRPRLQEARNDISSHHPRLVIAFLGALVFQLTKRPETRAEWVIYGLAGAGLVLGILTLAGILGHLLGVKAPHPLYKRKLRKLAKAQVDQLETLLEEFRSLLHREEGIGGKIDLAQASQAISQAYGTSERASKRANDQERHEEFKEISSMAVRITELHNLVKGHISALNGLFAVSGAHRTNPEFQKFLFIGLTELVGEYSKLAKEFENMHSRLGAVAIPNREIAPTTSFVRRYNAFVQNYSTFANAFPKEIASYGFRETFLRDPQIKSQD